ncbi:hypothetical protein HBH56_059360 [Parastagonospora nodorum]|uniref:Uncharacterized protein n=1 Tax=Phaeosphaeria nodorum (strain SN15 / ATCC MYA-4574 / FGSC 10173) TaxID=321614 RepID=A0A7U2HX04_PHANO|nr:hypothetical protein HBH56_059360 [Parastagonospora nodorum]QRC91801.1 hypothetical protein JI435_401700 [Parastagonospora nodorum SN15]KAH3930875.1 hypothetical protein HBH54_103290 [Parastagonospora nodorum]KAH4051446.1 hypothetical protein HBH49_117730 [Parastagonospora nodorum]KAH4121406.1 hypothetical protein HBH47_100230 [Parastagonospora nodorum]
MMESYVSYVSSLRKRSARMAFMLAQVIPGSAQHNVYMTKTIYATSYYTQLQLVSMDSGCLGFTFTSHGTVPVPKNFALTPHFTAERSLPRPQPFAQACKL